VEKDSLATDRLFYLYGFVSPTADVTGLQGVEPSSSVFLVVEDDVACAVTAVRGIDYCRDVLGVAEAQQFEWVKPRALCHHEVLQRLRASACPVVPLKFGTLAPDINHIRALLRRLREPIADLLAQFNGKDEWTLRIRFDVDALTTTLNDPRLELTSAQAKAPPTDGHGYFARKRLARLTSELLEERMLLIEEDVDGRIADARIEAAPAGRKRDQPDADRPSMSDTAILIPTRQFASLESMLADLEADYAGGGVTFELIGPWPPYSFTTTLDIVEVPLEAA
jgi:gas vesicle protein GvpL/GvpF